jgi:hypothetical protein
MVSSLIKAKMIVCNLTLLEAVNMGKWLLFVFAAVMLLSGCVSLSTQIMPGQEFKQYKAAYIEPLKDDEFNIVSAITFELSDIGIKVFGKPFETPSDTDMIVRCSYFDSWDMKKYLKSFQINFMNAKTGAIIANTSYESNGLWHGARDRRLEATFNDLRQKLGYPPTKQFE